ncbi:MAG: hypothetical protein MMC33_007683 [Icmadophila ericetorum]|nr:hypothetical protein [Icmadophila ericetorum]
MQYRSSLRVVLAALAVGAMAQNATDSGSAPTDSGSAATESSAATTTVSLSPIQITSLEVAEESYATGTVLASLISALETEIPKSIFTEYTAIGFDSLSAAYGSSFTAQSWFSDIDHVHTEVQNELQSIIIGVLNITANTTTTFVTPTTGAATVTQANFTTTASSTFSSATATPPSVVSAAATTTTASKAAAAMVTGGAKAVFGLAAAGLMGALL